jgi:hypothetical protein
VTVAGTPSASYSIQPCVGVVQTRMCGDVKHSREEMTNIRVSVHTKGAEACCELRTPRVLSKER